MAHVLLKILVLIVPLSSFAGESKTDFFKNIEKDLSRRHVHMMHLDGFRGDVFTDLLEHGQLPHFEFLLSRGKASYKASTVDKSETMKVIHSYLTSRRNTEVVGWWQFDRDHLQFENYWLDPIGVTDFALGVRFPLYPTIFDYLVSRGENVAAGFSLHRRSVKPQNYTRNYLEGFKAAIVDHNYFYQCRRTMEGIRNLYKRFAENANNEKFPVFMMSLLAAADEFGHLEGVMQKSPSKSSYCVQRKAGDEEKKDIYEIFFQLLEDQNLADGYFTKVAKDKAGAITEFCFRLPQLEFHAEPSLERKAKREFVSLHYVLAMMLIDMEVGNLINTLRSIRFDREGKLIYVEDGGGGIEKYLERGAPENSLLEQTLFVFLGDHGMLDTKHVMSPPKEDPYRADHYLAKTFLKYLNDAIGLRTIGLTEILLPQDSSEIGIDDAQQPRNLFTPHQVREWQSPEVQGMTESATRLTRSLFRIPIFPKLEAKANVYGVQLLENIPRLYLKSEPAYVEAEQKMREAFYEKHVRLIYGGGARNNAELFIPALRDGKYTWKTRPTLSDILSYRSGSLMRALKNNEGIGLIFIRKNNDAISAGHLPKGEMEILVLDRFGREGTIMVKKGPRSGKLFFAYEVNRSSVGDPLGYRFEGWPAHQFMTFDAWNDWSIENDMEYHNVVAGIGTYLYSDNPAIGDILLMNSQGWNFGDNAGGHGGVHKEEKQTVMLVSGPGIEPGELFSRGGHYPTVVDAAPTVLHWLGYGEKALTDFSRNGFPDYLKGWVSRQRQETAETVVHTFRGLFRKEVERLLKFIPTEPPPLPDFHEIEEDGNLLDL